VPEPFRQRCFELLLERLLSDLSPVPKPNAQGAAAPSVSTVDGHKDTPVGKDAIPTPAQVRVFMQKTGVTMEQLAAVVTVADGEVHFLREPAPDKVAKGQSQWALLLALKNGLSSNSFAVDAEAVRSVCQEKGFYDKGNFAKNFKNEATAKLFKKPLEPQGDSQGLSTEGTDALGDLIKSLASGK
jgi:hypothetical protein